MKLLITLMLALVFFQALAQDFTGTFRDDDGDLHTFEMQSDGTLLGKLTVNGKVLEVFFGVDKGQAFGVSEDEGSFTGFILTPISNQQLSVQVVPIDNNDQPVTNQVSTYTFTRETVTAQNENPLAAQTNNPLTLSASATNAALSSVPIETDKTYSAGTTLVSSQAGFSFTVPAGFSGSYHVSKQDNGLILQGQPGTTLIVQGFSGGSLNSVVGGLLALLGELEVVSVAEETATVIRATFQSVTADGAIISINLAARQGATGNIFLLTGVSGTEQSAAMNVVIDSTLASLQFTQPSAQQPFSLGGIELNIDDGSSTSNSSGDAHLSGIKKESYVFCSNGEYLYYMEDTTMFSGSLPSSDLSFSGEDSDQHQGRYEVITGILGEAYLSLQAADGRTFLYQMIESENAVMVNGSSFGVLQSTQCQ